RGRGEEREWRRRRIDKLCEECHDVDKEGKYKLESRWRDIAHPPYVEGRGSSFVTCRLGRFGIGRLQTCRHGRRYFSLCLGRGRRSIVLRVGTPGYDTATARGDADMSMYIGEAVVGEGNEGAHIDLLIGSKDGPGGVAFRNALR